MRSYRSCQSCGMPFHEDPKGGGTNADGSLSTMYCSYCWVQGKFMNPDWTAEQMKAFVQEKLKEKGFPGFVAWFFARGIPKLERWSGKKTA